MKKLTLLFAVIGGIFIFLLIKSCCGQYPLSEEELQWWEPWKKTDTTFYINNETGSIDTLIIQYKDFYQPEMGGFFSLNGFSLETTDHGEAKAIGIIGHNSKKYSFTFEIIAGSLGNYINIDLEFGMNKSRDFKDIDSNYIQFSHDDKWLNPDFYVDSVVIHRDSGLMAYKLDGAVYKRLY